jgi:hypothetical protein
LNYKCTADYLGKKHNRSFQGDQNDFFEPQIVLSAAMDNLGVKEFDAPLEKPHEMAKYLFCQHAKK